MVEINHDESQTHEQGSTANPFESLDFPSKTSSIEAWNFVNLYERLGHTIDLSDPCMDWTPYAEKSGVHCIGSGRFGDVYRGNLRLPAEVEQRLPDVAINVIRPMATQHLDSGKKAVRVSS